MDPCTDGNSVCGPNNVCVVSPETSENQRLVCRVCTELEPKIGDFCGRKAAAGDYESCKAEWREKVAACDVAACRDAYEVVR